MLIELSSLIEKHNMKISGVLHVGAHIGEEALAYHDAGINDVWWVEANPDLIPTLNANVARFCHHVINALVADREGDAWTLNVTNNLQSSSIFPLGTHRQSSPDVHYVAEQQHTARTVDSLVDEHDIKANFWNFDIQGAELRALRGATASLPMADYLYLEVNRGYVYQGNGLISELDHLLADEFSRSDTEWSGYGKGEWGDALWVRKGLS